jgi:hypothetical protein
VAPPGQNEQDDAATALFDAERDVMGLWEKWELTKKAPVPVPELLNSVPFLSQYISAAGKIYKDDAEGRSRMVLIAVAVALMTDRMSCEEFTVCKEHATGIDEEMLTHLLLGQVRERKLLHSLETYLERREKNTHYTSIMHDKVHDTAFSVRFARQNENMRGKLEHILSACDRNQRLKDKELEDSLEQ